MKTYTDLEQSKILSEFLPHETADMSYTFESSAFIFYGIVRYSEEPMLGKPICNPEKAIPCWSLAALLDVLPYPQLSKDKIGADKIGWMLSVYPDNCRYNSCWHDNPIDACYEMILKLKEQKLL